MFEHDGFQAARVSDIAERAGVSQGTFYTYFVSKSGVLETLTDALLEEMNDVIWEPIGADSLYEVIAVSNDRVWRFFDANSALLATIHAASGWEAVFFAKLGHYRRLYVTRYSKNLQSLQSRGLIHADLDPYHTAGCLAAMIDEVCRWWLCRQEEHDPDLAKDTLDKIWARALGVPIAATGTDPGVLGAAADDTPASRSAPDQGIAP